MRLQLRNTAFKLLYKRLSGLIFICMYVSGVQEVLGQVKSARCGQVRMLFKLPRLGFIRREVKSARCGQVRMLFKLQDLGLLDVKLIK